MTIDQISENTGVSKATIYRRWKDKSSIIVDMFVSRIHVLKMIIKRCTMNCIIF